jgi:hypothetical protein
MLSASSFQVPKRKQAAEAGERENIDHLQARDRAFVELGTHDQASSIVPYAIESGSRSETFCERAQVLILHYFTKFCSTSDSSLDLGDLVIERSKVFLPLCLVRSGLAA